MERVNRIIQNEEYKKHLKAIKKYEKGRRFCKHNIKHLLDVCRIAYIINLEKNSGIDKEIIYAAGLLHDIGKGKQYEDGTEHDIASAEYADNILMSSGFLRGEIDNIKEAILKHRKDESDENDENSLSWILYKADKLSRKCFYCKVESQCNWSCNKKNLNILY